MPQKPLFLGAATALITPFRHDAIDFNALGSLIDRQIEAHIDALVLCGSTGESATLTDRERSTMIAFAAERIGGRVPLIVGAGASGTDRTIALSRDACAAGADALLIATPTYNLPPQRALVRHFSMIADAVNRPIILYNIPSRTGCAISLDTYDTLANHGNIIAVKEAGGTIADAARFVARCGDRLDLYSGNDASLIPMLALGARGVISVASNLLPAKLHEICALWQSGLCRQAKEEAEALIPLYDALFCDANPIPLKAAMEMCGYCENSLRLPLVPLEGHKEDLVRKALKQCDFPL